MGEGILASPYIYDGESDKFSGAGVGSFRQSSFGFDDDDDDDSGVRDLVIWTGRCMCRRGYITFRDEESGRINECRDPVIITSSVGGRCLNNEHCR